MEITKLESEVSFSISIVIEGEYNEKNTLREDCSVPQNNTTVK